MPGEARPVHLIPVILTRPQGANTAFAAIIAPDVRARLHCIHSPLLDIVPIDTKIDFASADCAVFTSMNGVKFAPHGDHRRAFCVGQKTTQAALASGWDAIFAGATVAELKKFVLTKPPWGQIHHYSGVHTRGNVAGDLSHGGLNILNVALYDQRLLPLSTDALEVLNGTKPVLVPLFSPRTAVHFANAAPSLSNVHIVAMSDAVAGCLDKMHPACLKRAPEPTAKSMAICMENLVRTDSLG